MVENSMKKIEELLHNEMGYKKTIHELRLARETRSTPELDPEGLIKLLKKKEREYAERVKLLELEREALLSSLGGARDRAKYLEGSLSASEQELRRLLDDKRNY
jgi:aromatic ring hydroxylase